MRDTTRAVQRLIVTAALGGVVISTIVQAQNPPPQNPPAQPPAGVGPGGAQGRPGGPGGFGGGGRGMVGGWTTNRGDAQRTASVRSDEYISVQDLAKPGFGVEWTVLVGKTAGETLSEGVGNNTSQLNPAPGNIAGTDNNLYAYEVDTGSIVWTRHLDVAPGGTRTAACPGGLTAGVTRNTPLTGGVVGGRLGRTGSPFGSMRGAVGAPGEGVPPDILARGGFGRRGAPGGPGAAPAGPGGAPATPGAAGAPQGTPAGVPPGAPPGGGAAGAPPPLADAAGRAGGPGGPGAGRGGLQAVYTVTSDGLLRTIGQQEGKELVQPTKFLPPNARASSIVLVNQVMYATTTNDCGGVPNGVWALDQTNNNAVTSWKSGASPVGPITFSTSGTLFVALGDRPAAGGRARAAGSESTSAAAESGASANAIVALEPRTLTVKDWFTMPGASFSTSPMVFPVSGKEMVAAATKDGRVFLLDAASLGGTDHRTPLAVSAPTHTSKTWSPSALTAWEDDIKTRWLALAAAGNITAFKVNASSLERAWTTATKLASPSSPIVVNDVVFALDEGPGSAAAVLYAFDASSGKEIWNSSKTLKAPSRTALWSSSGQVYVVTTDRVLYAFGFSQDRHQ